MPVLTKLIIQDFRNIELQELEFSPNLNCISGNNGSGKTNLLDAIYYLSMTKSAIVSSDRFNYRYGTAGFSLAGTYRMENGTLSRFTLHCGDGKEKQMKRDDAPYTRISEHLGVLPVVMVSPADTSLVSDSGEERRHFVNAVLSQMDREYLVAAQQYNRLLAQRNRYLKDGAADGTLLDTLDERMDASAAVLYAKREEFVRKLVPSVAAFYAGISGGSEQVDIAYRSELGKGPLSQLLRAVRDKDRALGYTTAGVHRDDFLFRMDGEAIRRCGSQGQQKSFLVALKFAQYEIMKNKYGFPPMLLLDDLFDKLDINRITNLLQMVAGNDFGQIFLTDSNKTRISALVDRITSDRAYFETSGGTFTQIDG
ncbi:MAG: DNA replication and repair protein RecF [Bacteroidales bacterium]|nr:DNA replication and repair protein RecF [Bacteroidales bacterium]